MINGECGTGSLISLRNSWYPCDDKKSRRKRRAVKTTCTLNSDKTEGNFLQFFRIEFFLNLNQFLKISKSSVA